MVIARGVQESFTLIKRLGYRIYPTGKLLLDGGPAWMLAGVLWLMSRITSFRELLASGLGECRALVDAMLAAASRANSPVTVSRIAAMKPSAATRRLDLV